MLEFLVVAMAFGMVVESPASKIGLASSIFSFAEVVAEAISSGISYEKLNSYCKDCIEELKKAGHEIERQGNINIKQSDRIKHLEELVDKLQNKGDR